VLEELTKKSDFGLIMMKSHLGYKAINRLTHIGYYQIIKQLLMKKIQELKEFYQLVKTDNLKLGLK